MTTQVNNFDFNSNTIRVVKIDGEPWFVAKDVTDLLTVGNVSDATANLDQIEFRSLRLNGGRYGRPNKLISESGLYKIIMRSDKPQARPFQDWVTRVVLPAIRKDGGYVAGEEKLASGEMEEDEFILKAMQMLQKKVERLTQANEEMHEELTRVTIAEYAALNHVYLRQSEKGQLAVH